MTGTLWVMGWVRRSWDSEAEREDVGWYPCMLERWGRGWEPWVLEAVGRDWDL